LSTFSYHYSKLDSTDLDPSELNERERDKLVASAEFLSEKFRSLQISNPDESEKIAMQLLNNPFFNASAPVFQRLTIIYRKRKDYASEIDAAQTFLKFYQPQYGGNMWVDVFEARIKKANILLQKQFQ